MISFRERGDFSKASNKLERMLEVIKHSNLDKYGRDGVAALASATPKDSGQTAASWYYEIKHSGESTTISFLNSHINKGVNIAIILQYGHGTGRGGYVQGRDYINPAMRPIFDKIAEDAWKEITK